MNLRSAICDLRLSAVLALLAVQSSFAGSWHTSVGNVDSRVAEIAVESAFEKLPSAGYAPVRLVIDNNMGQAGVWDFSFSSASTYNNSRNFRSSARVEVSARAQRIVEVMVPLVTEGGGYSYPNLRVNVSGPGCGNAMASWSGYSSYSGNTKTPYIAMSDTLGVSFWGRIESDCRSASPALDLEGTQFDIKKVPADYRGWIGVDSLWLSDTDWTGLDSAHRQAVLDWVKLGGRLHVCFMGGSKSDPLPDLPQGDQLVGLGRFTRESAKDGGKFIPEVIRTLRAETKLEDVLRDNYGSGSAWALRASIPPIVIHTGLIMLFVCIFAALIGPVNLFALARRKKHMHLFWTTPALSIAASIGLALVIVLQDGFGGSGNRFAAVYLDGEAHKACVVQEQVARSGVLLNRTIPVREPFFITPVNTDKTSPASPRHVVVSGDNKSGTYILVPDSLSGDWFTSRTVDGHLLMQVQSTRARIEISEGPNGPTVTSGIGSTLKEVFYRDIKQNLWRVQNLKTGERREMKPSNQDEFSGWWNVERRATGGYLSARVEAQANQDEYFYAATAEATEQFIPTLPAIRWKENHILYFGPVTKAAKP